MPSSAQRMDDGVTDVRAPMARFCGGCADNPIIAPNPVQPSALNNPKEHSPFAPISPHFPPFPPFFFGFPFLFGNLRSNHPENGEFGVLPYSGANKGWGGLNKHSQPHNSIPIPWLQKMRKRHLLLVGQGAVCTRAEGRGDEPTAQMNSCTVAPPSPPKNRMPSWPSELRINSPIGFEPEVEPGRHSIALQLWQSS